MNLKKFLQSAAILLIVSFNSSYACGRFEYMLLLANENKKDLEEYAAKGLTKDSEFFKLAKHRTAAAKKFSALATRCLDSARDDELKQDFLKFKKANDDLAEIGDKVNKSMEDSAINTLGAVIDIFTDKVNPEEAFVNALAEGVNTHQLSKSFEEKYKIRNEIFDNFWKKSWSLLTEDEKKELNTIVKEINKIMKQQ